MVGGSAGSGVRREQGCSCRQQRSMRWRLLLSQAAACAKHLAPASLYFWRCNGTLVLQIRAAR